MCLNLDSLLIPDPRAPPISHLDILSLGHSHEVKCEDLQSLERKCVPGTGYEGISDISDPVHGEGDDEDVDDSNFVDDEV